MKIEVIRIPREGLTLEEEIPAADLDLDIGTIELRAPLKVKAELRKITNAVSIDLCWDVVVSSACSRCLNEFDINIGKKIKLIYSIESPDEIIDLNPDIREEIILDSPMKPLCRPDCKGLCSKCGKNLNEGKCNC